MNRRMVQNLLSKDHNVSIADKLNMMRAYDGMRKSSNNELEEAIQSLTNSTKPATTMSKHKHHKDKHHVNILAKLQIIKMSDKKLYKPSVAVNGRVSIFDKITILKKKKSRRFLLPNVKDLISRNSNTSSSSKVKLS